MVTLTGLHFPISFIQNDHSRPDLAGGQVIWSVGRAGTRIRSGGSWSGWRSQVSHGLRGDGVKSSQVVYGPGKVGSGSS